ncbi:MAG: LON peptidase substrate-binding domain-containing protein, partial [Planctomycetaceae bacterium]|nr:LON peptidase substrate-binding domain-containing protein [Planctomycetaceae bacterium]
MLPDDFNGRARLFPLPNVVLFPHVLQPLHVFEPRYRELTIDALATDQLIAMALLEPGWEKDYEGHPPVNSTACLAKIVSHQRLDDGRYNLLLAGLHRVQIVREIKSTKPFRTAEVKVIEDQYPLLGEPLRPMLFRKLIDEFVKRFLPKTPEARAQIEQLLGSEIPLGPVTDIISYTLDLAMAQKQELLAQPDVDRRAV